MKKIFINSVVATTMLANTGYATELTAADIRPGAREDDPAMMKDVVRATKLAFELSRNTEVPSPTYNNDFGFNILIDPSNPNNLKIGNDSIPLDTIRESRHENTIIIMDVNGDESYVQIDSTDHSSIMGVPTKINATKRNPKAYPPSAPRRDEAGNEYGAADEAGSYEAEDEARGGQAKKRTLNDAIPTSNSAFGVEIPVDNATGNLVINNKLYPLSMVRESSQPGSVIIKGTDGNEFIATIDPRNRRSARMTAMPKVANYGFQVAKDRAGNLLIGGKSVPPSKVRESRFANTLIIKGERDKEFYIEINPRDNTTIISQRDVDGEMITRPRTKNKGTPKGKDAAGSKENAKNPWGAVLKAVGKAIQ